jgi:16S rRNA G966 N2-methylase RsmD
MSKMRPIYFCSAVGDLILETRKNSKISFKHYKMDSNVLKFISKKFYRPSVDIIKSALLSIIKRK